MDTDKVFEHIGNIIFRRQEENMLHVKNIEDGFEVLQALGSEVRIHIIKLLQENHEMNMNELASQLGITNGALTGHIKKLEKSGIIKVVSEWGGHGNQKKCRIAMDKLLIDIKSEAALTEQNIYNTEVKIGHYSDYKVYPTCGIATDKAIVGQVDDPRYFAHQDRVNAGILWFSKGYVEYIIPNLLPSATKIDQITLSLEISSEAPGVNNDWPSDISIFLNDVKIGMWTSPGDYGDVSGIFTPSWWFPNWNQYGLLKMFEINSKGTFVDGLKISDVTINEFTLDYRSRIRFRFEVEEESANVGGMTIFGSKFGNYNQDIKVRIGYSSIEKDG